MFDLDKFDADLDRAEIDNMRNRRSAANRARDARFIEAQDRRKASRATTQQRRNVREFAGGAR